MPSEGSVTCWLDLLIEGDSAAAQPLWERYFEQLVGLARRKLQGSRICVADEEDVALSAFDSFCRAAGRGRFPELADREGLWRLLLQITARKAIDLRRRENRRKRGGGKMVGGSDLTPIGSASQADGRLAEIVGTGPTPEFAAMMAEQCRNLLDQLEEVDLKQIAIAKMEGQSNEEIARHLNCSVRTIERRLNLIRKKWQREEVP